MQNKTDKGTSLVSKSLPVVNSSSVYRLLSARKKKYYDSNSGVFYAIGQNVGVGEVDNLIERLITSAYLEIWKIV